MALAEGVNPSRDDTDTRPALPRLGLVRGGEGRRTTAQGSRDARER